MRSSLEPLINAIVKGPGYLTELVCYPLSHREYIRVDAAPNLEISRHPCSHSEQLTKNESDHGLQTLDGLRKRDEIASLHPILQRKLARSLFSPFFIRRALRPALP
jgi:hypothetical protein